MKFNEDFKWVGVHPEGYVRAFLRKPSKPWPWGFQQGERKVCSRLFDTSSLNDRCLYRIVCGEVDISSETKGVE